MCEARCACSGCRSLCIKAEKVKYVFFFTFLHSIWWAYITLHLGARSLDDIATFPTTVIHAAAEQTE